MRDCDFSLQLAKATNNLYFQEPEHRIEDCNWAYDAGKAILNPDDFFTCYATQQAMSGGRQVS